MMTAFHKTAAKQKKEEAFGCFLDFSKSRSYNRRYSLGRGREGLDIEQGPDSIAQGLAHHIRCSTDMAA